MRRAPFMQRYVKLRAVQRWALRSTACAPPACVPFLAISFAVGFTRHDRQRGVPEVAHLPPPPPSSETEPVRGPQRPLSRRADCVGGGRLRVSQVVALADDPSSSAICRRWYNAIEPHRRVRTLQSRFRFGSRSWWILGCVCDGHEQACRADDVVSKIACVIIATSSGETR